MRFLGRAASLTQQLLLSLTYLSCTDNISNKYVKILKRIRPRANNTENYWNDVKYVFLSAQLQNY